MTNLCLKNEILTLRLIVIGGNARLIQKALANDCFVSQFEKIIVYTKTKYSGRMLSDMEIFLAKDSKSLEFRLFKDVKCETRNVILYASVMTKRGAFPYGIEKMDPQFSFLLQDLTVAEDSIHRLVLLGSTEALPLLPGGDRYIVNKKFEYKHFLRLQRLYQNPKSCYVALPPLDTSDHWLGRYFVQSRERCASVVIKAINTQVPLMVPRGVFSWVAKITSFGILSDKF